MNDVAALPLDAETKVIERPSDHKDELRLWLRLFSCKMLIENEIRRRLRDNFEITLPRFDLMAQLDKAPAGMKLGELSQRLMVSNGNITGLVDRLVEQGLLDRQPAPNDRRAQLVKLTAEGRRSFRAMAASHEAWIAEILGDLSGSERDALMRLLGKAKTAARRAIADGDKD
jgi:DNA-binding MarR family transcriptional regulator